MKIKRTPRKNEVKSFMSDDESFCISIVRRKDDKYHYYYDMLSYEPEDDVYYWRFTMDPSSGIFETVDDIEKEILATFSEDLKSTRK